MSRTATFVAGAVGGVLLSLLVILGFLAVATDEEPAGVAAEAEPAAETRGQRDAGARDSPDEPAAGEQDAGAEGDLVGTVFDLGRTLVRTADETAQQLLELTPREQRELGAQMHRELVEAGDVREEGAGVDRVRGLTRPILDHHGEDPADYRFAIIEAPDEQGEPIINAFALVGGYVYVTEGLLDLLDDDELRFVLGHEVAHLLLGHAAEKVTYAGRAREVVGDASLAVQVLYNIVAAGYAEELEFEADAFAVETLLELGHGGSGAVGALQKLDEALDEPGPPRRRRGTGRVCSTAYGGASASTCGRTRRARSGFIAFDRLKSNGLVTIG